MVVQNGYCLFFFFLVKFIIFIFEDMANYKILKKTTIIKIELRNMCINLKSFIIYFKLFKSFIINFLLY